jgi:hypothetical protein
MSRTKILEIVQVQVPTSGACGCFFVFSEPLALALSFWVNWRLVLALEADDEREWERCCAVELTLVPLGAMAEHRV